MKKILLWGIPGLIAVVCIAWMAIAFNEATKEVRILCGMFRKGTPLDDVVRMLDTGNFLQYRVSSEGESQQIHVDSLYNWHTDSCHVSIENRVVVNAVYAD